MPRRIQKAETVWTKWSASKLSATMACPLRGFYSYALRTPKPQNPLAALGQALHYMFQRFFTPHKKTGNYPYQEVEKLLGVWKGFWWRAIQGHHGFSSMSSDPVEVTWKDSDQQGKMFGSGINILKGFFETFHQLRLDGIPRFNERRFTFDWCGLQLTGVIDRLDITPQGAILLDYKGAPHSRHDLETGLQLTIYQLAYEAYLRRKIGDNQPLSEMQIYSYWRNDFQDAPLRTENDFGMLLYYLLEAHEYFRAILTGKPVYRDIVSCFRFFSEDDILTGDITPRLPRGSHCRFCQFFTECRQWELKEHPTPQALFAEHRQAKLDRLTPGQEPIPFGQQPIIEAGGDFVAKIRQLPFYRQGDLFGNVTRHE
jgi:hypothetical protein